MEMLYDCNIGRGRRSACIQTQSSKASTRFDWNCRWLLLRSPMAQKNRVLITCFLEKSKGREERERNTAQKRHPWRPSSSHFPHPLLRRRKLHTSRNSGEERGKQSASQTSKYLFPPLSRFTKSAFAHPLCSNPCGNSLCLCSPKPKEKDHL